MELSRLCAERGHDLVLVARGHERLKATAHDFEDIYNVKVVAIEQDLSEAGAATKLAKRLDKEGIQIDALINNAGFGLGGRFDHQDIKPLEAMMQVNMATVTDLTRLLVPGMVERGYGRVLNLASTAAFLPGPYMAVYYATKAYVLSFSQAIAQELQGTGVTVTALCPGPTKTHFAAAAKMQNSRLFSGHLMSAAIVARAGYDGMMAGKEVVVPGASNKLLITISRFLPRSILARMARRVQDPSS